MRKSVDAVPAARGQRGTRGAQAIVFLALCLIWMYDGAFLAVGGRLYSDWPSFLETLAFVAAAWILLANRVRWLEFAGRPLEDWPHVGIAIVLTVYLVTMTFGSLHLLDPLMLVGALVLTAGAIAAVRQGRDAWGMAALFALTCFLAIRDLARVPLESLFHGTALHLVYVGAVEFLGGANPYRLYGDPVNGALNYFPMLWMPFVPWIRAGIDMRLANIVSLALLMLVALVFVRRLSAAQGRQAQMIGLFCCVSLFLNPGFIDNLVNLQVAPDWVYLFVTTLGLAVGQPVLAAIGLGLSLAGRQTTVAIAAIAWLVFHRLFKGGSRYMFAAAIGAALIVLPFLLRDPEEFFGATVLFTEDWGMNRWAGDQVQKTLITFSAPFYLYGWYSLLQPIQLVLTGGLTVWWLRQKIDRPANGIVAIASVYAVFIAFNPAIWNYYWLPVLLLTLAAILSGMAEPASGEHPAGASPSRS